MSLTETNDLFPRIWDAWTTLVIAVGTILLVGVGFVLTERALTTVVDVAGVGPLGWMLYFGIGWAGLGLGATYGYLRIMDNADKFTLELPSGGGRRLLGGLLGAVIAVFTAGAIGVALDIVPATPFGFLTSYVYSVPGGSLESWPALVGGMLFTMVLLAVFVGPAIAAVTHGIIQNAVRDVASPQVAIGATAFFLAVFLGGGVVPLGIGSFLLAVGLATVSGYAYHRTKNLVIPMCIYGLTAALGLVVTMLPMILDLSAEFGTSLP